MNEYFEKINLLASELSNMSPKTQLEIVKLCKNICLQLNEAIENGVVATNEDIATLNNAITNLQEALDDKATTDDLNNAIADLQEAINEMPIINISTDSRNKVSNIQKVVNGIPTLYQVTHTHCYFVEVTNTSNTLKLYFNLFTDSVSASTTFTALQVFSAIASLPYETGFIASGVMNEIGSMWHLISVKHRYTGISNIYVEGVASGISPYGISISQSDFTNTSLYTVNATLMY